MPFPKGNQAAVGRSKGMGRRMLTKSIKEALEGRGKYSFDDIANRLITIAMEEDDHSIALKAIKEITDRVEGKAPMQKEEGDSNLLGTQQRVFFIGVDNASPRLVESNGHAPIELHPTDDHTNGTAT